MGLSTNIHYVKSIKIEPIEDADGTYWRKIMVCFEDGQETIRFELALFGKPEDLKIKIPAPISAEVEI